MNWFLLLVVLSALWTEVLSKSIPHDQVQPFAEIEPVTETDKVIFKYKPLLKVSEGCQPYAAVQEDGSVSKGIPWFFKSGSSAKDCEGSELGSQIYARATEFKGVYAIVYAWYFPRGREPVSAMGLWPFGHRHNFDSVIVWLDKLSLNNSEILGVSTFSFNFVYGFYNKYTNHVPLDAKYLSGSSVKIEYHNNLVLASTEVRVTTKEGEYQDLITWDQLPDAARDALANTDWDTTILNAYGARMPLKDSTFTKKLEQAWPFD
ncbi:Necrosis inducing protein NPP1 [Phytophthora megakarya]|uniref:Necrosis inducing protein NPP1 n=1 Tax=Phytophthora megakarya TaxID=4795 RepID=A0A225WBX2_9STRA|nr:Necrosis inducing protein NPP1 [Phytophthora megakarya]